MLSFKLFNNRKTEINHYEKAEKKEFNLTEEEIALFERVTPIAKDFLNRKVSYSGTIQSGFISKAVRDGRRPECDEAYTLTNLDFLQLLSKAGLYSNSADMTSQLEKFEHYTKYFSKSALILSQLNECTFTNEKEFLQDDSQVIPTVDIKTQVEVIKFLKENNVPVYRYTFKTALKRLNAGNMDSELVNNFMTARQQDAQSE